MKSLRLDHPVLVYFADTSVHVAKWLAPRDSNCLCLPMHATRSVDISDLVVNITLCRLLNDLRSVEISLKFWSSRLHKHDQQANAFFLFLSQGPTHFFSRLTEHVHKIWTFIKLRMNGSSTEAAAHVAMSSMREAQEEILKKETHLRAIRDSIAKAVIRVHRACSHNNVDGIISDLLVDIQPQLPILSPEKVLHRAFSTGGRNPITDSYSHLKQECRSALDRFALCPTAALRSLKIDLQTGYLPPLISLPPSLAAPSRMQQRWLLEVVKGLSLLATIRFLFSHSRLAGSDNLEVWTRSALTSIQSAWKDHVIEPLENLKAELCRTFREKPGLVSQAEYESDKEALRRMLKAFERDWTGPAVKSSEAQGLTSNSPSLAEGDEAFLNGMKLVMDKYESELRQPLRNLLVGDLARAMLIQVQRLKIDTEAAMLKLDQILKASEFSLSIMAAFPALAFVWITLSSLIRSLIPSQPDFNRDAVAFRCSIADFNRALHTMRGAGDDEEASRGMVLYHLARVSRELERLYERYDRDSKRSEYPGLSSFVNDLVLIASGKARFAAEDMEIVVDRMRVSYRAMQH